MLIAWTTPDGLDLQPLTAWTSRCDTTGTDTCRGKKSPE